MFLVVATVGEVLTSFLGINRRGCSGDFRLLSRSKDALSVCSPQSSLTE